MSLKLPARPSSTLSLKHEINVTPFIDVMLVLLIIFMVAAPLATRQMPVDLPKVSAGSATPEQPITLWITENGLWYINDTLIEKDQLIVAIESVNSAVSSVDSSAGLTVADSSSLTQNPRVQIRADKALPYEQVIEAMNRLSAAGYTQIGLIGADSASGSSPDGSLNSGAVAADHSGVTGDSATTLAGQAANPRLTQVASAGAVQ